MIQRSERPQLARKWLVALAGTALLRPAAALEGAGGDGASELACREAAVRFLSDPALLPGLRLGTRRPVSHLAGCVVFEVLAASGSVARAGSVAVNTQDRTVRAFSEPAQLYLRANTMPVDALRAAAESFGSRWLPESFRERRPVGPPPGLARPSSTGSVGFVWWLTVDGVRLPRNAAVHVVASSGRVRSWRVNNSEVVVDTASRLSSILAESKARAHLAGLGFVAGERLSSRCLVCSDSPTGEQRVQYEMLFAEAQRPVSRYAASVAGVILDGTTGEVHDANEFMMPLERIKWCREGYDIADLGNSPVVEDERPCWLGSGNGGERIVFASTRARPGRPAWSGGPRTIFSVDPTTAALTCLVQALDSARDLPDAGMDAVSLSTNGDDEYAVLDLRTGQLKDATTARRPGCDLTVSRDGRRLAYASDRGGSDNDIFVADRSDPAGTERRVIKMAGEDRYPRLSPDGSVVYFVHEHYQRGQRRPSYELWVANARWPYQENDPPRRVLAGLPMIERMTISADGRRLLLWHPPGMSVVDPTTGGREELVWPELHDPDYPDTPPLGVAEPAISGDGHWVAFQGRRLLYPMETNPASYLYVCDLRGANLRRLTPLANDTVPPLRFPATGKLAFEIGDDLPEMQAAMR